MPRSRGRDGRPEVDQLEPGPDQPQSRRCGFGTPGSGTLYLDHPLVLLPVVTNASGFATLKLSVHASLPAKHPWLRSSEPEDDCAPGEDVDGQWHRGRNSVVLSPCGLGGLSGSLSSAARCSVFMPRRGSNLEFTRQHGDDPCAGQTTGQTNTYPYPLPQMGRALLLDSA